MARILLVEDDRSMRNIYAFALQKEGFEVIMAESGAEAVDRVEEQRFDVILLDMLMMGMSGLDFLRTYNVKKKAPQTRVIALTNFDNERIQDKARELGVDEYLEKARYEPRQLVEHVRAVLARPKAG